MVNFKLSTMKRIGLVSDTHGLLDERVFEHFINCDEVWHAGDIGSFEVYKSLCNFKPTRAVWGNIDAYDLRAEIPQHNKFMCENVSVWLTHIGGYPGKYDKTVKEELMINSPKLFVCGHSHILRVKYDSDLEMLCINPGAAGKYGFHNVQTIVRFEIDGDSVQNL